MMNIINMKVNLMEVNEKNLKEGEIMEAMVKVNKVDNQTTTQTITTTKNVGTW